MTGEEALQLADWRRQVDELYGQVRLLGGANIAWRVWREGKEALYREHPQSPIPVDWRDVYEFACFAYDPSMRVLAELVVEAPRHLDGDGEVPGMTSVGALRFQLAGEERRLAAYWLDGYAGGLFVPFTDATSGDETYGGGRYLIDTAKGADLGTSDGLIILNFNFAYAPSCAHDHRWRCPLAGPESRLDVAVQAGEIGP